MSKGALCFCILSLSRIHTQNKSTSSTMQREGWSPGPLLSKRKEQVSKEMPRQKLLSSLQTAERQLKGHDLGSTVMMGRLDDLEGLLQP